MHVRTPTILQMEAVECGAAALGIVLSYYGQDIPLGKLRQMCGITQSGSQASNMILAARQCGMKAEGYRMEVSDLRQQSFPLIVFWNFNHFLVVEGFSRNRVFLNDPATGPRQVSWAEFTQGFTGIVLAIRPEKSLTKTTQRRLFKKFFSIVSRLRGVVGGILYCALVGFLLVIPGILIPVLIQLLVDWGLVNTGGGGLSFLTLGLVLAAGLQGLLLLLRIRMMRRLKLRLTVDMSSRYVRQLLSLPIDFYTQRFPGEVSDRLRLNEITAQSLSSSLVTAIVDAAAVIAYGLVMLTYDPLLTVVSMSGVVVNLLTLNWALRQSKDTALRLTQAKGQAAAVGIAGLQNLETIKASALESEFFSRWAGYWTKVLNTEQELELPNQILLIPALLLRILIAALILGVGSLKVMEGTLTLGMLIAFYSLVQQIQHPASVLIQSLTILQELIANLERLDEILHYPTDSGLQDAAQCPKKQLDQTTPCVTLTADRIPSSSPTPADYPGGILSENRLRGFVELRQVKFGYAQVISPLIQEVSLYIQPGQLVGLVGFNGSGKSTIARLVSGLYQPWAGKILFDGISRNTIEHEILSHSFALAEQHPNLIAGTVRDNLTLWDSSIPDAQLVQACQDADIHQAILAIPGAYDGWVAEDGANFSGSQQQQLEIARALVKNPTILVFDEAISALDRRTQQLILSNIRRRECTCLLITHCVNVLQECDEIFILNQGKIINNGNHQYLQQHEQLYQYLTQQLVKQQTIVKNPGSSLDSQTKVS
ncbi:MAG: NHLP family bacteriocin export ABC transporter peptidase/permease/ATPase subunit [Microcoleaceae cyanobacterium]